MHPRRRPCLRLLPPLLLLHRLLPPMLHRLPPPLLNRLPPLLLYRLPPLLLHRLPPLPRALLRLPRREES